MYSLFHVCENKYLLSGEVNTIVTSGSWEDFLFGGLAGGFANSAIGNKSFR
jgi:hypothetical protein